MIRTLAVITASTSGHTDFVVDVILARLQHELPHLSIKRLRAETAVPADIAHVDALILGSGTWNTGGVEGQLNPHMHALLFQRLSDAPLRGMPVAFVSLGDDRYYFTTRCTEHFLRFQRMAGMTALVSPLIIVNEPYDQEEKILAWTTKLIAALRDRTPAMRGADAAR